MTVMWFVNPKELFASDKVSEFWPNASQSPPDRINATSRFIIYTSLVLYLIRRDIRVLVLAVVVLAGLYVVQKNGLVSNSVGRPWSSGTDNDNRSPCTQPTADNPMANALLYQIDDDPNRAPACYYPTVRPEVEGLLDNTLPVSLGRSGPVLPHFQQKAAARQWVSAPVSTIPSAQTDFAEWCYGKKFRPMCRDTPWACSPDARGVDLDTRSGLDAAGNHRAAPGHASS